MNATRLGAAAEAHLSIVFAVACAAFLLIVSSTLQAENWIRGYGTAGIEDYGRGAPTADGGYVLVGRLRSFIDAGGIPIVVKLDPRGDVTWHKIYTPDGSGTMRPWALQPTHDGGYIMSGSIYDLNGDPQDLFLMKLDASGEVTWAFAYGGSTTVDGQDNRMNIVELPGGAFATAAFYDYEDGRQTNGLWLLTVSSTGAVVSNHMYTRHGYSTLPLECQRTGDGGFVLAGSTTYALPDFAVIKVDSSGLIQWQTAIGGLGWDALESGVREVPGGDLVVAGTLSLTWGTAREGWIGRLDGASGAIRWQNTYGTEMAGHPELNTEGHIVVASRDEDEDCRGLIGIDPADGGLLWQSGLVPAAVYNWLDPLPGGGLFATGNYGPWTNPDLLALKLDGRGGLGDPCALTCALEVISGATALVPTLPEYLPFTGFAVRAVELDVAASTSTVGSATVCSSANRSPVADAGNDQETHEGEVVMIDGSLSYDPDGDTLTCEWTQVAGPAVTLTSSEACSAHFTAPAVGPAGASLTFLLTVDDGFEGIASDEVTVNVLNLNDPPVCSAAAASPARLWPVDHALVPIDILGVTDLDGDDLTVTVNAVTQDEPVKGIGAGDISPDAFISAGSASLRAERSGKGNGRVYQIGFIADDGAGGSCSGTANVCVPRERNGRCKDDGQNYNSLLP